MAFTTKNWQNGSAGGTPLNATALIDMETRLAAYTDTVIGTTANIKRVAIHNGTSYPSRPSGASSVEWIGPTDPGSAAQTNDTWIPTS